MYSRSKNPLLPHRGFTVLFSSVVFTQRKLLRTENMQGFFFFPPFVHEKQYFSHSPQLSGERRTAHIPQWTSSGRKKDPIMYLKLKE